MRLRPGRFSNRPYDALRNITKRFFPPSPAIAARAVREPPLRSVTKHYETSRNTTERPACPNAFIIPSFSVDILWTRGYALVGRIANRPYESGIMPYDPEIHHRRSIRLRGYDYSQPGEYFVTICTEGKEHLLGQVVEGEMHRNEWGDSVARCWKWLTRRYSHVGLDAWIIMPNHLHGIIVITDGTGGSATAPHVQSLAKAVEGGSRTAPTKRKPLGSLVGAFKTVSTEDVNALRGAPNRTLWQRDFYDHIVRDEDELNKIREYIQTNPLRWATDPELI